MAIHVKFCTDNANHHNTELASCISNTLGEAISKGINRLIARLADMKQYGGFYTDNVKGIKLLISYCPNDDLFCKKEIVRKAFENSDDIKSDIIDYVITNYDSIENLIELHKDILIYIVPKISGIASASKLFFVKVNYFDIEYDAIDYSNLYDLYAWLSKVDYLSDISFQICEMTSSADLLIPGKDKYITLPSEDNLDNILSSIRNWIKTEGIAIAKKYYERFI